MRLFVNAVITGIGLKLGSDLYKYVKQRLGFRDDEKDESLEGAERQS